MTALARTEAAAVVVHQPTHAETWNNERRSMIRRVYAPKATDDEFRAFEAACARTNLSPETRQIFAIARWDSMKGAEVTSIQVSIDGLRLIAERTGRYAGQTPTQWCGKDGKWVDIWLEDAPPFAARVGVLKVGFAEPLYRVAKYSAFVQLKQNKQPTAMWFKMADHMLAKCAEALALRAAFPQECSGLFTIEEMGQAENDRQPPPPQVQATVVEPEVKQLAQSNQPPDMLAPQHEKPAPAIFSKKHPRYREDERGKPCALVSELSDEELYKWGRGLSIMLEGYTAKGDEKNVAIYTRELGWVKDYAATRGITDFSERKEDRNAQLQAAIGPKPEPKPEPENVGKYEYSDEMYLCVDPKTNADDLDIRTWTNIESLVEYEIWLQKFFIEPTQTTRIALVQARTKQLVDEEAKLAEQALSVQ